MKVHFWGANSLQTVLYQRTTNIQQVYEEQSVSIDILHLKTQRRLWEGKQKMELKIINFTLIDLKTNKCACAAPGSILWNPRVPPNTDGKPMNRNFSGDTAVFFTLTMALRRQQSSATGFSITTKRWRFALTKNTKLCPAEFSAPKLI